MYDIVNVSNFFFSSPICICCHVCLAHVFSVSRLLVLAPGFHLEAKNPSNYVLPIGMGDVQFNMDIYLIRIV